MVGDPCFGELVDGFLQLGAEVVSGLSLCDAFDLRCERCAPLGHVVVDGEFGFAEAAGGVPCDPVGVGWGVFFVGCVVVDGLEVLVNLVIDALFVDCSESDAVAAATDCGE